MHLPDIRYLLERAIGLALNALTSYSRSNSCGLRLSRARTPNTYGTSPLANFPRFVGSPGPQRCEPVNGLSAPAPPPDRQSTFPVGRQLTRKS